MYSRSSLSLRFGPLLLAVFAPIAVFIACGEVTTDTRIESADRQFVVLSKNGDQIPPAIGRIEIVASATGKTVFNSEVNPPLYFLKWTGDSQTLVSVQHVAGGSVAEIIHLSSGKWIAFQAEPQVDGKATVVACKPTMHDVELSYKINQQTAGAEEGRFLVSTFTVDPETGAHSNETTRQIDGETYRHLRLE